MKKSLLAGALIVGSLAYILASRATFSATPTFADAAQTATQSSSPATPVVATTASTQLPASVPSASPSAPAKPATPTPTPAPVRKPSGQYVDGTYAGSVADAYYGNIQVEAVISGGRLATVRILQYPNDRGTSIEINRQALPMLISEAVSAQSANVDGISGASETSPAFVESLSSALAKAKA